RRLEPARAAGCAAHLQSDSRVVQPGAFRLPDGPLSDRGGDRKATAEMNEDYAMPAPVDNTSHQNWPRPTRQEILAARGKSVRDVIAPGLKILFCGINPGLYTAAVGHHFARPGNRFWPALHQAGFTSRQLSPFEERELLDLGYGVTNVV